MFKIIGADQKEYGPISTEQIRQWIKDNRLNAQTAAQREGGEWQRIGDFPEFADLFQAAGTAAPSAAPSPFPSAPVTGVPMGGLGGSRESALQAVKVPAIILIVMAAIGIALNLFSAIGHFMGAAMFNQPPNANIPQEYQKWVEMSQGPAGGLMALVFVALNVVVLLGALKMMRLENRSLAMAACIISLIPCNCCCLLIPFGIWGLIVLNKPEVKSQFTS